MSQSGTMTRSGRPRTPDWRKLTTWAMALALSGASWAGLAVAADILVDAIG